MRFPRASGILLHPTSLPGRFGIGDLGPEAYRFVDFLEAAGQRVWQVLPLGPTGYGDSPFQCFSSFAGNPLLISPEKLLEEGLLTTSDLEEAPAFPKHEVDFGSVIEYRRGLLEKSFVQFNARASQADREEFDAFCAQNATWLDDYALFMALKNVHDGDPWNTWETEVAMREPSALDRCRETLAEPIQSHKYAQFRFFKQWAALKRYCNERNIAVIGDLPIYVAYDSADVWCHPDIFHLDKDRVPTVVAGVPPDYFSKTGQLWGNPLYRWDVLAESGYQWWIERFRATLTFFDRVRLDHFRGFQAYWKVPANEETAVNGRWAEGPGAALIEALITALGPLPIIAENLGLITDEVEALRAQFAFPGMAVLQFAFDGDPENLHLPHNYPRNTVAYTGTHDNDTVMGWWSGAEGRDSTRTKRQIRSERAFARRYLGVSGRAFHWACIRAVLASVADTAVIPMQDILGLGSEARMNLPGSLGGNWRWRYTTDMPTDLVGDRLRECTAVYGR